MQVKEILKNNKIQFNMMTKISERGPNVENNYVEKDLKQINIKVKNSFFII